MNKSITVSITVNATPARVWECWTQPEHITKWNFASDDWECPKASSDLRVGGAFSSTMAAKDKSFSFDFAGTFTAVEPEKLLEYSFGDRKATVRFTPVEGGVKIDETFDMEGENSEEKQREGWQAILGNFKKHAEGHE
jgi:uncharacterized protein YndB with AHSA1/START domain